MAENAEAALAAATSASDLVPGDTGGLTLVADAMRRQAAVLDEGGSALSRVEVTSWRGPASQGFASTIEVEPGRWRAAADAFTDAAAAIDAFVSAFPAARDLAARALAAYRAYQQRVADAGLGTGGALSPAMAVGARIVTLQQAEGARDPAVGDAEALRRTAIDLLASARSVIDAAGVETAAALSRAAQPAPQARRLWESNIRPADAIGVGHDALAVGGFLPGVGAWPDGVNAAWYATEGNWAEAGWSAVALVPLAGDWLAASRRTARAVDLAAAVRAGQRVPPRGPASGPGWLLSHEVDGSHTIERHVGATRTYLVSRLYGLNAIKLASSFSNVGDAEKYVSRALGEGDARIQRFLANSSKQRTSFVVDLGEPVGYGVSSNDGVETLSAVEVRLIKDSSAPDGYRVWTAFPTKGP